MINFIAISDTHCHFDIIEQIIEKECQIHPDIVGVLHCGDVSFYDVATLNSISPKEQNLLEKHANPVHLFTPYLNKTKHFLLPVYAIPGNHEDYNLVAQLQTGERTVNGLHVLKQGECCQIKTGNKNINILGIGKVLPWQHVGFKNNSSRIQEQDLKVARQAGRQNSIDVMLIHEPPLLLTSTRKLYKG
ncbi:hypothetical protein TI03_03130 [Achromatium sp. WMS1]|nr:hypothetical protein TI03_03130 [Achromatium sp. WMS1]